MTYNNFFNRPLHNLGQIFIEQLSVLQENVLQKPCRSEAAESPVESQSQSGGQVGVSREMESQIRQNQGLAGPVEEGCLVEVRHASNKLLLQIPRLKAPRQNAVLGEVRTFFRQTRSQQDLGLRKLLDSVVNIKVVHLVGCQQRSDLTKLSDYCNIVFSQRTGRDQEQFPIDPNNRGPGSNSATCERERERYRPDVITERYHRRIVKYFY